MNLNQVVKVRKLKTLKATAWHGGVGKSSLLKTIKWRVRPSGNSKKKKEQNFIFYTDRAGRSTVAKQTGKQRANALGRGVVFKQAQSQLQLLTLLGGGTREQKSGGGEI